MVAEHQRLLDEIARDSWRWTDQELQDRAVHLDDDGAEWFARLRAAHRPLPGVAAMCNLYRASPDLPSPAPRTPRDEVDRLVALLEEKVVT